MFIFLSLSLQYISLLVSSWQLTYSTISLSLFLHLCFCFSISAPSDHSNLRLSISLHISLLVSSWKSSIRSLYILSIYFSIFCPIWSVYLRLSISFYVTITLFHCRIFLTISLSHHLFLLISISFSPSPAPSDKSTSVSIFLFISLSLYSSPVSTMFLSFFLTIYFSIQIGLSPSLYLCLSHYLSISLPVSSWQPSNYLSLSHYLFLFIPVSFFYLLPLLISLFTSLYLTVSILSLYISLYPAGNYSRLACEIQFVRSMGYYLIQIYIPSSLIVVISWVSFWLNRQGGCLPCACMRSRLKQKYLNLLAPKYRWSSFLLFERCAIRAASFYVTFLTPTCGPFKL